MKQFSTDKPPARPNLATIERIVVAFLAGVVAFLLLNLVSALEF
jgi:hypothetical protein